MSHWQSYHTQWETVGPPLRTSEVVVEFMVKLVKPGPVLLLGVTPELAEAFDDVKAIDKSAAMVEKVWPGDAARKKAEVGDWLLMDEPRDHYAAVVGDGSLNNIGYPSDIARVMELSLGMLKPHGRFACRLFERPAVPLSWDELRLVGTRPAALNFHAFKWQLAMRICADEGANVGVTPILQRFEELFPDRDWLAEKTGWPRRAIDTIDIYRNSPIAYSFPDRAEFEACIPAGAREPRFLACGDYDLAECCPVLTFQK
jgi:SAM-dependent methyltransferase